MVSFFSRNTPKEKLESDRHNGQSDFEDLDLRGADLTGVKLSEFKFKHCNLEGACLRGAELDKAVIFQSNLQKATFDNAKIFDTFLDCSDFYRATFEGTQFHSVYFSDAFLCMADFSRAVLMGLNFSGATVFHAKFLETCIAFCEFDGLIFPQGIAQEGAALDALPNVVDFATVDTTAKFFAERQKMLSSTPSAGRLYGSISGIKQFCSTLSNHRVSYFNIMQEGYLKGREPLHIFISYADEDRAFVNTLQKKLERRGCTAWFAPRNMEGGQTIEQQLASAIDQANAVVVVLSPNSVASEWVAHEVRYAGHKVKAAKGDLAFFPIRITSYEDIQKWRVVDDSGYDLASDLRSYFVPDFSGWNETDLFNRSGTEGFELALDNLVADMSKKLRSSSANVQ